MKALTALVTIAILATSSIATAQPPAMTPGDGQQAGAEASTAYRNIALTAGVLTLIGVGAGFFRTNNRTTVVIQHSAPTQ